ncbi:MAG: TIGR03032 family protein [Gammaproteobacteria bacterium]|nr:TIGR03032 family protein [Gammaproteobacteria bacterium]
MTPTDEANAAGAEQPPRLEISASRQFTAWLAEQKASLAFTTYQTGKVFFIGLGPDQRLSIFERTFNRCMGMYASPDARTLYMSSLYQLWRFEQAFEPGEAHDGYDALYIPQLGYVTGDLDIHDITVDASGRPVFVNTLFSCLATTSETHSFTPLWQPPFISRLAAEDRCHLNGLATADGQVRYVTSVSESDVADGWREHRSKGGVLMEVPSGEVVLGDLSMPHSPRLYQGRLWLLDSGRGYFGYADLEKGRFEPVAFCPGYMRGLSFIGNYAVVGLSLPRHNKTFQGLVLDDELARRKATARCGLEVIDLRSGDVVHSVRIEGIVEELYDVVTLAGVRRPMALGFKSDEIRRHLMMGEPGAL